MSTQEDLSCVCKELPQVDFSTFVLSMASTALVHLGEVPEPESGAIRTDLIAAKQTIDILCMLQCKTKGNLTDSENRLLMDLLYELRLKYVQRAG
ncbi:hypothetical protein TDMWS_03390 [Thermodesulfomicrobium sp. WS]|uniref:DUF1844 domain-containing protein n=1 Tax=Thermodesulfomicrobium sp. WS TaxID=3004129 RepID=UPI0024931515|nr:DUF1844 domain-containing protein [Thermodesulfomicrobium sp. WS]BDV00254.1 hypothetical protein TDMWS_03390 [Thermodesulfomicrobium sp. WS]